MSSDVEKDAISVQARLKYLSTGDLAELRRASPMGSPAFWRLAANYPNTIDKRPERWVYIIASMAELTTSVAQSKTQASIVHDRKASLGMLFATGGILKSGPVSNPLLSERRLANLALLRGKKRCQQLHRVVKMVKSKSRPPYRINVSELAWAFLDEKTGRPEQRIAREYYRHVK